VSKFPLSTYGAARWWARLAREEENGIKLGIVDPVSGTHRADTYRRTARALLHKHKTGIAICVCCFKPFSEGSRILGGAAKWGSA
jgi:hypothetical protein